MPQNDRKNSGIVKTEPIHTRRAFLREAAAVAVATPVFAATSTAWAQPATHPATQAATRPAPLPPSGDRWTPANASDIQPSRAENGVNYWNKGTRLTIAMWDFSWLLASEPGGAYHDLDRRLAEARERGYNTLRVDVFVAHQLKKEWTFEKNWDGHGLPKWGMTPTTFTTNVRERVAELARLCRKHDLWLGLDSWKSTPGGGATPEKMEQVFTAFGEKWAQALQIMREDGVLERAVWVAPLNEAPLFLSMTVPSIQAIVREPLREGLTEMDKSEELDAIYQKINHWMAGPIKAEIEGDGIPISYSSLSAENYAERLTDLYDVVDVHFMPAVVTDAEDREALEAAGTGTSVFPRWAELEGADLRAFSTAWDRACRKHYQAMLRRAYTYHENALNHMTLPSGKRLQAVITESFGPCYWPVHHDVNQKWYKRYNADAMRVISSLPYSGTTLSNYAEPIFPELWADVDWHWLPNEYFLSQTEVAAKLLA